MHLTAKFKLRANNHDRYRLRRALARWSASMMGEALDRARSRQGELLRCLVMAGEGEKQRLGVDRKRVHAVALACCRDLPAFPLHSSASMSLVVALEAMLRSWLGLYLDWIKGQRKLPKPAFPSLPPGSRHGAAERWEAALGQTQRIMSLAEEQGWRAEVTRASRARLLPLYFGAATSGVAGQAHCGLLRRQDGRLFALLTLWPQQDALGAPVERARNRRHAGAIRNIRGDAEFSPSDRARASIIVPLEFSQGDDPATAHGRENMFLRRGVPKCAELVEREGEFYLHVAFDFTPPPRRPTPHLLTVKRGIGTLLAYVVSAADGTEIARGIVEGRTLVGLVTAIRRVRAQKQAAGHILRGDRRLARVTEHHLFSAAHQIIDLACRHGAAIVLLKDPFARRPQRFLAYKHFSQMADILGYLAAEAGLPAVREREIYGPPQTCVGCGWKPGDPVRREDAQQDQCPGCGRRRDREYDAAVLLALDTQRLSAAVAVRPSLPDFVRQRALTAPPLTDIIAPSEP